MISNVVLVAMFMSLLFMVSLILRYAPNISERYIYRVYVYIAIFLFLKIFIYLFHFFKLIDFQNFVFLSGMSNVVLGIYYAFNINYNFGHEAIKRKKRQDILNAKESFGNGSPLAIWVKEYDIANDVFIMRELNDTYENMFLKPIGKTKSDYIGFDDFKIQGYKIGREVHDNDYKVWSTGICDDYTEDFKTPQGVSKGRFKKWKSGNYICGACLYIEPIN